MKIKLSEKQITSEKYGYALGLGYRPKFTDAFKILYRAASQGEWDARCTIESKIDNISNYKITLPFPLDSIFFGILNLYYLLQSAVWLLIFLLILILTPILYILLILKAKDNRIYFNNLSEDKQKIVRDLFYND